MQSNALQSYLEKYLPQFEWRHSSVLLSRLWQGLLPAQLLTVRLASSNWRNDDSGGALLAGLIKTNHCGDFVLEDCTGRVECELSKECIEQVSAGLEETVLLLTHWQFVQPANSKRSHGYLEVSQMQVLHNTPSPLSVCRDKLFTLASLKHSRKTHNHPARARVDIVAMVTAVGEVLCNGPGGSYTVAMELQDESSSVEPSLLIVQSPMLLYFAKIVNFQDKYLFTHIRDMVMNKNTPTERRALATTAESAILPYSLVLECSSPDSKRLKMEGVDPGSHYLTAALPRPKPGFVSYQGTLSEYMLPEAGLYKLDDSVLLYMVDHHCVNGGRGLRPGASVELYNVHAMKLSSPLQHASGFYCCAKSLVRVTNFSPSSLSFKPFLSQNKLSCLLRKYSPIDAAYLIQTYLLLRKRYRVETCYSVIKELIVIAGISPIEKDHVSHFISSPHTCSFTLTQDHHGNQPVVADNLSDFQQSLADRGWLPGGGEGGGGGRGAQAKSLDADLPVSETATSSHVGMTTSDQWSHISISGSQLPAEVLVGRLECCRETGYLTVADETGAIPVLCMMPLAPPTDHDSTHKSLVHGIGNTVLLSGLTVYVERRTATPPQKTSHSLLTYISPHRWAIITPTQPSQTGNESQLYFFVVNKNCVVKSSCEIRFNAVVMMGNSLQSLKQQSEKGVELPSSSASEASVEVVVCFCGNAFKWYSSIINGGAYSLSSHDKLPSLEELSHSNFLEVTSDMKVKLVDNLSQSQPVQEVSSLVERSPLPGFLGSSELDKDVHINESMCSELFSLRAVVVSHEYRVPHSTISAPPTSTTPTKEMILALKVQSLSHPDTIMVYYGLKAGQPRPLGLLPGATVTFHSLILRTSKRGNVYCESSASSNVTLHQLGPLTSHQPTPVSCSALTPQMLALPQAYMGDLIQSLLSGCLTRRIVCLHCRITSVQRLSLQYKCLSCDCTVVDGHCMVACPLSRPSFKAEARFIVDDGTGEGQLYASSSMVRETMGMTEREWMELKEIAVEVGQLVFTKATAEHPHQVDSSKLLSAKGRGKAMISKLASRLSIQRLLKVYCQPFVSQTEQQEGVVGCRQQVRRGYSSLSLPRLQLRCVAMMEVTSSTALCCDVTRQLMERYQNLDSDVVSTQ